MTPTPPSATASSAGGQYSPDAQYRVVRKRNRVPLSCAPCRNRKLKCNRSQPCENCVKRGDSISCSYVAIGSRKKQSSSSQSSSSPDGMQDRIDRLEGLVLSLMTNGTQSAGAAAATRALSMSDSSASLDYPHDVDVDVDVNDQENTMSKGDGDEAESETEQVSQSLGMMKVNNNQSMYFGDAHWATILSDIAEVKNYFAEHQKQYEEQMRKVQESKKREESIQVPTFLFGGAKKPEYSELLSSLPKRTVADKLVARYFNTYDPAIHILHPSSWHRMYEKHWDDPMKTGPVLLGQIFAILCLAMHSYYRMGDEPPEYQGKGQSLAATYRNLTAQCLLLADITRPVNHMIETLILHLHSEIAKNREAEVGVWVLVGMIVRLAMRMGYHRDPKHYSNITPFQGEIRRRVWTFVRQSDLLFSFQIGLPSMIRLGDCDAEVPRNLFDEELDEDMKAIPPSRPVTEATPVSYVIAKASIAYAFGKVIESLNSLTPCTYDDILVLDQNLRDARAEFPPHLRLRTIEESMLDPGILVTQRFNLAILYHKGQCVLHRKFLARARENNRYSHSRRTCVDSSMELLRHQATLHYESQPGRRLHGLKVFTNSLTAHDFLLAAMIICLDLWYGAEAEGAGRSSGDLYTWGLERRADMIQALEVSNDIWTSIKDQSMEAFKASATLTLILNKLKYNQSVPGQSASFPFSSAANGAESSTAFRSQAEEKPEHSAAMTLGMLSNGGMTPNSTAMFGRSFSPMPNKNVNLSEIQPSGLTPNYNIDQSTNGALSASMPFTFLGNGNPMMEMPPANLDWDAWDSYIQNASLDPSNQILPTNMDLPLNSTLEGQQSSSHHHQQHQQANAFGDGGVFMGVSTPPGNASMLVGPTGNLPITHVTAESRSAESQPHHKSVMSSLNAIYQSFLTNATASSLSNDAASLNYITTLTTINSATSIIKHVAAHQQVLKKKRETVLHCIESENEICLDVETTLEFVTGGGAYLPGLDDNFLADRVVTFPIIHIVHFDSNQKIQTIRLHWDQGSLLKLVDVIGSRAKNWPIRDGKDQARLIASTVTSSQKNGSAQSGLKNRAPGKNETITSSQPTASTGNVTGAQDKNQETTYQPAAVAPRASAKPPPRDYHDLFAGNESDTSPAAKSGYSPQKENRGLKAKSANPPPRDYHDLFVGNESDASPVANTKTSSPQKPDKTTTSGLHAPKGGAGKHFLPSRLFGADNSEPGAPGTPEEPQEKFIKPHPKKFNHFDFNGENEDDKAEPVQIRPKTKHQSQWDFEDFMTPEKVPQKIRDQDVRHFGWSDDEPNLDSPVKQPKVIRPRPDSKANFEFKDDGTPASGRRPGHPRGQSVNNGMSLYRNNVINDSDRSSSPEKKSHPLSTVTNLQERRKDLDPQFSLTDDSPADHSSKGNNKPVPESRNKAVKMMDAQWEASDESPRPAHKPQNSNGENAEYSVLSSRDQGDYSSTSNRNLGIKTGGDGMGGKKGTGRTWGFGSESDEDGQGGVNSGKFKAGKKQQAPKENTFWDF